MLTIDFAPRLKIILAIGPPDQQAQVYQEGYDAQSELLSETSLLHLLSSNQEYPASTPLIDRLTSKRDFSPKTSLLPSALSGLASNEHARFSLPSPNLPFFDSTEHFLEGLSALPEESTIHLTPSYGLETSNLSPDPGLLEPQASVLGDLQTDWGGTESSIDSNRLMEYIQELEGLIGHQG